MNLIAHDHIDRMLREAARRRRIRNLRRKSRAESEAIKLPYPHSRNDCQECRERDADMIISRRGMERMRTCQFCAGPLLAGLVDRGMTAAARPIGSGGGR